MARSPAEHEDPRGSSADPKHGHSCRLYGCPQSGGITFKQNGTGSEEKYYLETMGTGVGWIDFDQDGLLDLYFVQTSARRMGRSKTSHSFPEWRQAPTASMKPAWASMRLTWMATDGWISTSPTSTLNSTDSTTTIMTGLFGDVTYQCGIGNSAIFLSGVAAAFADYDNDGGTDIMQVNGSMLDNIKLYHTEVTYKEPKLMFRNLGKGKFAKVSKELGTGFMRPVAGRGLAAADFDNDGDIDFAINGRDNFPELLRKDDGNANNWLTVNLVGVKSNGDGLGSVLKMISEGFTQIKQSKGGMSYMSASDPRIHLGLGKRKSFESL